MSDKLQFVVGRAWGHLSDPGTNKSLSLKIAQSERLDPALVD